MTKTKPSEQIFRAEDGWVEGDKVKLIKSLLPMYDEYVGEVFTLGESEWREFSLLREDGTELGLDGYNAEFEKVEEMKYEIGRWYPNTGERPEGVVEFNWKGVTGSEYNNAVNDCYFNWDNRTFSLGGALLVAAWSPTELAPTHKFKVGDEVIPNGYSYGRVTEVRIDLPSPAYTVRIMADTGCMELYFNQADLKPLKKD